MGAHLNENKIGVGGDVVLTGKNDHNNYFRLYKIVQPT